MLGLHKVFCALRTAMPEYFLSNPARIFHGVFYRTWSEQCSSFFKVDKSLSNTNDKPYLTKGISITKMYFNKEQTEEVKRILDRTTNKFTQFGKLYIRDISKLLLELEKYTIYLNNDNISELFKVTSYVVSKECRPCSHLVTRFWNLIKSSKCVISQKELVSFLQMCIDSNTNIVNLDILSYINNNDSLTFSQEVGEMLLFNNAQFGDNEGSKYTLLLMKKHNLILSEEVFSSLLLVNAINHNEKEIEDILDAVKRANIPWSDDLETVHLIAHFYSGNFDRVRKIIDRMKMSPNKMSLRQFSDVIFHFVKSKNFKSHSSILDYMLNSASAISTELNLKKMLMRLIYENYPKEAIYILCNLPNVKVNPRTYNNNVTIYLQELARTKCDASVVVELCSAVKESGLNDFALVITLETALWESNLELSWALLRVLKARGDVLREHFFWPLLAIQFPERDDAAEVIGRLSGMLELGVTPSTETLIRYVIPRLPIDNVDVTLKMLLKAGITETRSLIPLMSVLIANYQIKEATSLLKKFKSQIPVDDLMKDLSKVYLDSPKKAFELLTAILSNENVNRERDFGGQWLRHLFSFREIGSDIVKIYEALQLMKDAEIKISVSSCEELIGLVQKRVNISPRKSFEELVGQTVLENPEAQSEEITLNELEAQLIELKSKNMNTRGLLRKLLILHSSAKNMSRVRELMEEIRAEESEMSAGMRSSELQAKLMAKDVEGALESYHLVNLQFPEFQIDSYKVLDLCSLLMEQRRSTHATQLLSDYINRTPKKFHNRRAILRNCHHLMELVVQTMDYETTKEFAHLLMEGGLADPSTVILGSLIKAALKSNDLRRVVTEAEEIYSKYHLLPMRVEILLHLMTSLNREKESAVKSDKSDAKLYAHLMDQMIGLCTKARGAKQAREDLLVASIEVGDKNECLRIFKFVENDLSAHRIQQLCNHYTRHEKVDSLLTLLRVTKGSGKVDRIYICQCLLNIYIVRRSGEEGLNLWAIMQEEGVTATEFFMSKLGSLLKETNTHDPFRAHPQCSGSNNVVEPR